MANLLKELLLELKLTKFERAKALIKPMIVNGRFSAEEIMDKMVRALDIKDSTADTYYHIIAKEFAREDDEPVDGVDLPDIEKQNDESLPDEDSESVSSEDDEDSLSGLDDEELEDGQFYSDDDQKQGIIRRIEGAHLVYKRKNDAGLFDELWIYNTTQKIGTAINIKKDILAATDIPPKATTSEDGSQKYTLTTLGDVTFLHIMNLPQ